MQPFIRHIVILFSLCLVSSAYAAPAATFSLSTTAFLDHGAMPVLYSCDGKDISPALSWTHTPAKTQSFVLIVSDPDAIGGVWYHWVVYNIPKDITELPEGISTLPKQARAAQTSWNKAQYNGPCPPNDTVHTYLFTLYAVDTQLSLSPSATAQDVLNAIKGHTAGSATLTGIYSRWIK